MAVQQVNVDQFTLINKSMCNIREPDGRICGTAVFKVSADTSPDWSSMIATRMGLDPTMGWFCLRDVSHEKNQEKREKLLMKDFSNKNTPRFLF